MNLKDKIVLVTGASSGIGRAIAIAFANEGSKVIVNYRVNEKGAEETLHQIEGINAGHSIVQADISQPEDIQKMFDYVKDKYDNLDVLVNNAAIPTDKEDFLTASAASIYEMVNTDLVGHMICSQKAIPLMPNGGKILNTSSIRGWGAGGRAPVYAASKAGLNSLTKTLAKMVAPKIQVNAVAPGFVKTRSYDGMAEENLSKYIDQTYLKRWVTEEEIADAFIFLAKNDAMTGQVIYVDGGFTLK